MAEGISGIGSGTTSIATSTQSRGTGENALKPSSDSAGSTSSQSAQSSGNFVEKGSTISVTA